MMKPGVRTSAKIVVEWIVEPLVANIVIVYVPRGVVEDEVMAISEVAVEKLVVSVTLGGLIDVVSPGADTFAVRNIVPANPEWLEILMVVIAFVPASIVRLFGDVEIEKSGPRTMSEMVTELGGEVPLVPVIVNV
jgi:hypothetical protein